MSRDREEFPCWLVSDAKGALAYDWHEVRLVEVADTGAASLFLDDGSEWLFQAVAPVANGQQFFRAWARVLMFRDNGQIKAPC